MQTQKAIRYSVNTCPICDFTLGKARRSIVALSLSLSFLCVKRSPIRYGFRAGAKAIRYSVNTCPICDFTLGKAWRSIAALSLSLSLSLSFLCVKRSPIWYGFRAGAKAIRYSVNTYPICDFTLEKSAAQHRCVIVIVIVLMREKKPYLVWFSCRHQSYPA